MKAGLPQVHHPFNSGAGVSTVEAAIGLVAVLVFCCGVLDFSAVTWSRHQLAGAADAGARKASVTASSGQTELQSEINEILHGMPFLTDAQVTISSKETLSGDTAETGWRVTAQAWHTFYFLRLIGFPGVTLRETVIYRSEEQADHLDYVSTAEK